ncbi:MAG: hypothetical protein PHN77_21150 [Thermoguttaceae bacterium]|jgi:siroheme synthase (precorrin-2 oxidase/ferrochelatase)|nr:hypothetical protein [Thermoguttaceae bacterium]
MRVDRIPALLVCLVLSTLLIGCGGDVSNPKVHSFKLQFENLRIAKTTDEASLKQSIQDHLSHEFEMTHYELEHGELGAFVIIQLNFSEEVPAEEIRTQLSNLKGIKSVDIY